MFDEFVHYVSAIKSMYVRYIFHYFFTSTYIAKTMDCICRNDHLYTSQHCENNWQMMKRKKQKKEKMI